MPRLSEPSQKQLEFVRWYTSPASPTYDNVLQSALRAGYTESYAKNDAYRKLKPMAKKLVTSKLAKDVDKSIERGQFYTDLLTDSEKGIAKRVRMDTKDDIKLIQVQQKEQQFVAERLGKERWSTRESEEKGGLVAVPANALSALANALDSLSHGKEQPKHIEHEDITPAKLPESIDDDDSVTE